MNPYSDYQTYLVQYCCYGKINLGLIMYAPKLQLSKVLITKRLARILAFDESLSTESLNFTIDLLKKTFVKDRSNVLFCANGMFVNFGGVKWLDETIQAKQAYFPDITFKKLDNKMVVDDKSYINQMVANYL